MQEVISLSTCSADEAVVVHVEGGVDLTRRLAEMGFLPGVHVAIVERSHHGPMVVMVKGTKVALGRGMAEKVMVRPVAPPQASRIVRVALAGNPNAGKSTVFNALTGERQDEGNYPGVTVEKKEGTAMHHGRELRVVDLPGTYSLTAYSVEEVIARNYLIHDRPDVVVNIVDAANLERNLYLTTQLMELDVPLVIVLNKQDLADERGMTIDRAVLEGLVGVPVITAVAAKRKGMAELLEAIIAVGTRERRVQPARIQYGEEIEVALGLLETKVKECGGLFDRYGARWLAVKMLERDKAIGAMIEGLRAHHPEAVREIEQLIERQVKRLRAVFADAPEIVMADRRYGFISGACSEAVKTSVETRHAQSDAIDKILIHPVLGLPIFLASMWLVFESVFKVAEFPAAYIERGVGWCSTWLAAHLASPLVRSLVVDGVVEGVGSVLTFLPTIIILFLSIAALHDSGYMARAPFVMDKLMHRIGLHGKSFLPMMLGFGCTVPALMGTRILENRNDRLITMLIVPFMSCGARLPVYALFISVFFPPAMAGHVLFALYLLGISVAAVSARLLRRFLFPGTSASFVMELPPYRMPALRGLVIHMWMRTKHFLKKAGTVIVAASIILWFLMTFPAAPRHARDHADAPLAHTYAGMIGRALEPVSQPLGFDWKMNVALLSGIAAKEVIISTMAQLYAVGEHEGAASSTGLREAIRRDPAFSPLIACSLLVFILLYVPCIPALGALWQEARRLRWMVFIILYTSSVAWLVAFCLYQGGRLVGLG